MLHVLYTCSKAHRARSTYLGYPQHQFSIHILKFMSRASTVMVEVKFHFLHYPFLSLYPVTRPQLEFGGGRPLASATSDLLRMILSPKETFSRAIGQRTFGHEMAMLDEPCGWRDGVEGVDGMTSFWSFFGFFFVYGEVEGSIRNGERKIFCFFLFLFLSFTLYILIRS